jgi:extradiol dioxygenase
MIKALGYLGVSSPRSDDWRVFGTEFLGGELAEDGPDGAVRLRVDDATWRIQIHPGEADKTEYFGWLVDYEEDLPRVVARLAEAGVTAEQGSPELAASRNVNQLVVFTDPWGFRHEVAWGQEAHPSSFRPGRAISGFVTGQQGLGHVVLMIPDVDKGHEFFSGVLGFELSDKIIVPGALNARFYHVNARHHTLAIAQSPPGVAIFNHLMLQVRSIDDVGWAHDNLERFEVPPVMSLGRHTNDKMISFYCTTPSGFNIEYGYDGLEITDDWVPRVYTRSSIWGHKFAPGAGPGIVHPLAD